ncbi:MAG: hypothetical protein LW878_00750 [Proteobacteria bacterium]|jgi:hypothetical protein|nr:hypothetical protein [Pseudomonadota bacterium]
MDLFTERMNALKAQGLGQEELIKEVAGQIKNPQAAAEMTEILKVIATEKLSDAEASEMLLTIRDLSFEEGASWTGNAVATTAVIMAIIIGTAVVLYAINGRKIRKAQEDCQGSGDSGAQTNTTDCERGSRHWWWH